MERKILVFVLSAVLLFSGTGCAFVVETEKSGDGKTPVITVDPESKGFVFQTVCTVPTIVFST